MMKKAMTNTGEGEEVALITLLRAIAGGLNAKEQQHDIIFNGAADLIASLSRQLAEAQKQHSETCLKAGLALAGAHGEVERIKIAARDVFERDRGGCRCIHISREAEQEYETGNCPHQRLHALSTTAHSREDLDNRDDGQAPAPANIGRKLTPLETEILGALRDAKAAIIHLCGEIACEETIHTIYKVIAKVERY